jgi:hypothetical protein
MLRLAGEPHAGGAGHVFSVPYPAGGVNMKLGPEAKAAIWGAVGGAIGPLIVAVFFLGSLNGRIESLERGSIPADVRAKLLQDLRDSLRGIVSSASVSSNQPAASFVEPANKTTVRGHIMARGFSHSIPKGSELRLFVYSVRNNLYFQSGRVDLQIDGKWVAPLALSEVSGDSLFDLLVVMVDSSAMKEINENNENYRYGSSDFPPGASILDRISVVSKR